MSAEPTNARTGTFFSFAAALFMLITLPDNGATRAKSVGNAAAMLHVPVPPMLCPVRDILLLSMPYGVTVISIRLRTAFAALPHPAVSADSCGIRTHARTSPNIPVCSYFGKPSAAVIRLRSFPLPLPPCR